MNRNYVAYAYVYVYVSYKNEILKKREDVGKRLRGYWEEVADIYVEKNSFKC